MKCVTFNVRYATDADGRYAWSQRRARLCAQVLAWRPEVVGFQEVLAEQRADLNQALGGFYHSLGVGRDAGGGGEQCPIFFRRDTFTLLDSSTFWLSDTPSVAGSRHWKELPVEPILPRICTWARLQGPHFTVTVFNTHWDHQLPEARQLSARLLVSHMNEARARQERVIMMGDLNATEEEEAIGWLGEEFVNCFRRCGPVGAAPFTYHGYAGLQAEDGCHIDYIFVGPEFSVKDCRVLTESGPDYLSDHFAVEAQLS